MIPCVRCCGLLAAMLLSSAAIAAEPVFKCVDAQGAVAYQDKPCPRAAQQTEVEPSEHVSPPAGAPDEPAARAPAARDASAPRTPRAPTAAAVPAESWQCNASDGEVFYRHDVCPDTITTTITQVCGKRGCIDRTNTAHVTASAVTRAEACGQIHAPAAGDRPGHQHDQTVSTYEHDLGHDPCD